MKRYFNAKDIYDEMRRNGTLRPTDHSQEWKAWGEWLEKALKEAKI